jgi:CubicO group peptidase (beta-lactamase class C family)
MRNSTVHVRVALLIATLLVPLVSPQIASAQQVFPPDSAVLAIIKQRVEEKRSAGIVIGILEPDGRTRIVAFGDPGAGQPPLDGNTVFEIGSISKVFTATVLAELVKEGKVKLEDPVQKYLPPSVHLPTRSEKQITLGNLSEQNSGLPRMPSNFHPKDPSNPYADYSVQQMYDFVSGYQLTRDPGALFEYSNLGVGLLGHALSLSTGQSYEQMERKRVWEPLKMTNTAIGLNWIIQHTGTNTIVWHNGGTGGYRTFLGLDPSSKTAVVVMTNSGGAGADDIGMHLLNPAIPLTPN